MAGTTTPCLPGPNGLNDGIPHTRCSDRRISGTVIVGVMAQVNCSGREQFCKTIMTSAFRYDEIDELFSCRVVIAQRHKTFGPTASLVAGVWRCCLENFE
jgi:hypothetical protein